MKPQVKIGYFMILIAGILWGSIGFFVNILKQLGAESSTIAFLRIGIGAILLIPLLLFTGGINLFKINIKGLAICMLIGVLCQALFNYAYNISIERVGVATAAVLLYTSPIFVCVMSKMFFKEPIGIVKIIALTINIFGCILTVTNGNFKAIRFSVIGVILGICSGFLYALLTIISKPTTGRYHPLTIMFYSFLFGALALTCASRPWVNIANIISAKFLLYSIGYGLIPTVGSYFFYMQGLNRNIETSKAPVIASIETVVSAIIGIFAFQEASGLFKIFGIICVLGSIAIMNMDTSS